MHWYSSGVSGSTLNCSITSVSSPAESRSPRRNVLGSLPSQSAKSIASYHLRSGWVTLDSIGQTGSGEMHLQTFLQPSASAMAVHCGAPLPLHL